MTLPAETVAELHQIAARYPQGRSGLLPMLHLVQSVEGQVTAEGIQVCADVLDISAAQVSGVATFYTMYKRRPVGDYHVGVCTNTLCAVMGGDEIFDRLKSHLDVGNDETTDDGAVTLEHIECNAACDYAPVMTVNWEFMDNMTPDSAVALVEELRAGTEVTSTRGARICDWRQAERVLAGFPDGRVDEGPAAGAPSLLGLRIAEERGWSAPDGDYPGDKPSGHGVAQDDPEKASAESYADRSFSETQLAGSDAEQKHLDDPDDKDTQSS